MTSTYRFLLRYYFILFPAIALVIFFPMLGRTFASDDFSVIRRVASDRSFLSPGFFRPLSDLSFLLNYLVGRFNPAGYYLFNIILHGIDASLLFYFCLRLQLRMTAPLQQLFAMCAASIFLTYPFHSEAVVWLLGRGASLAAGCGLISLICVVSPGQTRLNMLLSCIFYFVGMLAYESIVCYR